MGRAITLGNPPFSVDLRRSKRARRLSLRVSRLTGTVTLTIPQRAPEREALAFLESREDWIAGHLAAIVPSDRPGLGEQVPFAGEMLTLAGGTGRIRREDDRLILHTGKPVGPQVSAFYKTQARTALTESSDRYAAQVGRSYRKITLRDTRSRWGSCSSRGGLMYSWRLIMAPPAVLDYVAAHEVAHLVEMNHSAAFWGVVKRICPDYAPLRQWLRDNGEDLHRVILTD
jgi:predicted metal-dependent hydrolase